MIKLTLVERSSCRKRGEPRLTVEKRPSARGHKRPWARKGSDSFEIEFPVIMGGKLGKVFKLLAFGHDQILDQNIR